jgi:hypothetical protein
MRLIDADALKERVGKICDKAEEEYEHTSLTRLTWIFQGLKNALFTEIDNEPTAQTWVTCEEKLPEMKVTCDDSLFKVYRSEPVVVQTKRGEIFLAVCKKTECKDNRRWDSVDWYTSGTGGRKMKVMSKVVAWMPQPEPWKPNF